MAKIQNNQDPKKFITYLYKNGWKIIHIKRRNKLRLSISTFIADKRRIYHNIDDSTKLGKIHVNTNDIISNTKKHEEVEITREKILENVPHLTIIYEDHLLKESDHQRTANRIFTYLGLETALVKTKFRRIASDRLSDFIGNYEELIQAISKTEYGRYLTDLDK